MNKQFPIPNQNNNLESSLYNLEAEQSLLGALNPNSGLDC